MTNYLKSVIIAIAVVGGVHVARGADIRATLDLLDLSRPGLEEVATLHAAGCDSAAATALLSYYRHRTGVYQTGVNTDSVTVSGQERQWADDGLRHVFFVHKGYQPSFFYGDDIDWTYWPVHDNELRWQLHRTKWWVPMGKVYRGTGDERYAVEWVAQYRDWIRKNPPVDMDIELFEMHGPAMADSLAENARFAWRPLEVADRLEHQIEMFELFKTSPAFTPEFLIDFLDNYARHARYLGRHYSRAGNHLLFEAQRMTFAGAFFPEFKDAPVWRRSGIDILNAQMPLQVLPDGTQYELDPGYHMACINIFIKALEMLDVNGYRGEFPPEYLDTLQRMAGQSLDLMFPDYSQPLFSDNRAIDRSGMVRNFKTWSRMFPDNEYLEWAATEGARGRRPDWLSKAYPDGGFYVLRNGWEPSSTVMVFKAGPAGAWHNQPDNGTFELWSNGRNFFPDSGSYVYGGDDEVMQQRQWFRQTRVHNTLTLDDRDLERRESRLLRREDGPQTDMVAVETPGYDGLTHRRAVWFVDRRFFVIDDEASGSATGDVAIHYNILECEPAVDTAAHSVATALPDGNNMKLHVFGAERMTTEEGRVSRVYREQNQRPAFAFRTAKRTAAPVRFITVIVPGADADTKIKATRHGDKIRVEIDCRKYDLTAAF